MTAKLAKGTKILWGDGGAAATAATLTLGSGASAVKFDALAAGTAGNSITITMTNPGGTASLAVSVLGTAITVALGTSSGSIISTANDVIAGIFGSAAARALVTASATGTGLGAVAAVTATALAGGTASAETFADLPGVGDISFDPGSYSQSDYSSHETVGTAPDMINDAFTAPATASFPLYWDGANAAHEAFHADYFANVRRNCKIVPPVSSGDKTYSFIAQITSLTAAYPTKSALTRDVSLICTGITYA